MRTSWLLRANITWPHGYTRLALNRLEGHLEGRISIQLIFMTVEVECCMWLRRGSFSRATARGRSAMLHVQVLSSAQPMQPPGAPVELPMSSAGRVGRH